MEQKSGSGLNAIITQPSLNYNQLGVIKLTANNRNTPETFNASYQILKQLQNYSSVCECDHTETELRKKITSPNSSYKVF